MSFQRYPKYKDSGVEWLGQVPAHWDVIPLSRITISRSQDWATTITRLVGLVSHRPGSNRRW